MRERDRQTDRQTNRHRQTDRQRDRQTDRDRDKERQRQRERGADAFVFTRLILTGTKCRLEFRLPITAAHHGLNFETGTQFNTHVK